jgi:alpha-tubulin suppressor-like RCC1 family protein
MRWLVAIAVIVATMTQGCVAIDDFGRFSFDGRGDASVPDGGGGDSRVGDGSLPDSMIPPGDALGDVVDLSVGVGHTCAVLSGGRLVCWGSNSEGELGQSIGGSSISYPIEVPLTAEAHDVACGWDFTCAIVGSDHHVECFGWNDEGQLGDGSTDNHSTPAPVPGVTNARLIDAGSATACVVGDLGGATDSVICWGDNGTGQVGSGSTELSVLTPEAVAITGATQIAVGGNHACAIQGGGLHCWGSDICGELGISDGGSLSTPTSVPGLGTVTAVSTGTDSTCAISDGSLFCWGNNEVKQAGQATGDIHMTVQPVDIPGGTPERLADGVGGFHACAVLTDGQVFCWGEANLLGAGPMDLPNGRAMPIAVTGLTDATHVSLSARHSCALRGDGTVRCWGYGSTGQLGTGAGTEDSFTPVTVVEVGTP